MIPATAPLIAKRNALSLHSPKRRILNQRIYHECHRQIERDVAFARGFERFLAEEIARD